MSTLYALGCSHTRYCWPTYADHLALEYDNYENWGQSGFGNFAIMNRAIEIADKATTQDLVIVQWTYPTRFDFHKEGSGWYQGGNLINNNDHIQQIVNKYAFDPNSYEWHTNTYIKLVKMYFDNKNINYKMIGADFDVESLPALSIMSDFDIPLRKFLNASPGRVVIPRKEFDPHWTPKHHLKYLEESGFTITEKMLQYNNKVEELLDEITDWKWINHKMVQQNYIESGDYGR